MTPLDRMLAEWECTKLSHAFSYHLDQRNYIDLANLFTSDGVWIRHGSALRGRNDIVAAMNGRPANRFTRHITTGFHFSHLAETAARSVAYNISYFSLEADTLPTRYQPENFLLFDFIDNYMKTADGWRFSERISTEIMISDKVRALMAGHQ